MQRRITRTRGKRYCTIEIELKPCQGLETGRLSITGEEGRIVSVANAKKEAIQYWKSFFEENRGELHAMNDKCGTNFRSALSAAKYVLRVDGPFHGLDATDMHDGTVRVLESCGCMHETLGEWFPEFAPLFAWHLNDMNAGCEHQDKLGWGKGYTVAITRHTATPVQLKVEQAKLDEQYNRQIEFLFGSAWEEIRLSEGMTASTVRGMKGPGSSCSIDEANVIRTKESLLDSHWAKKFRAQVKEYVRSCLRKENPAPVFDHAVYPDSISAPCPECGYRYGTEWLKRELPEEIVELAKKAC